MEEIARELHLSGDEVEAISAAGLIEADPGVTEAA
jgi:hypothetical protein